MDRVSAARIHGGPDAGGVLPHDFSANANACGPWAAAQMAVAAAEAQHYPDPAYTGLRAALADRHGVDPARVALAGSGSEFIYRVTAWAARRGARVVSVPQPGYGDYAAAASAWGLQVGSDDEGAQLAWACEPSSPLGRSDARLSALRSHPGTVVVDRAYEPLRLFGIRRPTPPNAWELWTPNKALGLTGVRAAYAIAPAGGETLVGELEALAPSWLLGAHGVALLQAWCEPTCAGWLERSLPTLREWKQRQIAICEALGWAVQASDANFFVADAQLSPEERDALRRRGIRLRDCTSFGLPGHVRLAVRPPASQDALRRAVEALR